MRVCLWNHHSPYIFLLAAALPDVEFSVLPTAGHAPNGWRYGQRPVPPNVMVAREFPTGMDVVVLQTAADFGAVPTSRGGGLPWVMLSHNRADLEPEAARLAPWLSAHAVPLVSISKMKAGTWYDAGYTRTDLPIRVIEPGIDVTQYPEWTGEDAHLLTVVNGIARPLFDLEAWLAVTADLPVRLVGEGNDGIPGAVGPSESWDALREEYRRARVYLHPAAPPYEDQDNLASIEARACGMPVFSLWGWQRRASKPAIAAARQTLVNTLTIKALALAPSNRKAVAERWSLERFGATWRSVLEEACR